MSWWASAGTWSCFWMHHRYEAVSGVIWIADSPRRLPSNPQECAAGTHGILAILTTSSSPLLGSTRTTHPSAYTHNHHPFSPGRHGLGGRSACLPPNPSLRCTTVPLPVYVPHRFIRRLAGIRKRLRDWAKRSAFSKHVCSVFDTCDSTARDGHLVRR